MPVKGHNSHAIPGAPTGPYSSIDEPGKPTFSQSEWRDIFRRRANRGGLTEREQGVVRSMRAMGSSWSTIRVEVGCGRYSIDQLKAAAEK